MLAPIALILATEGTRALARSARPDAAPAEGHNLPEVSYFQLVRVYSIAEVCVFAALLVVAIGGLSEPAEQALGWTHGVGWILLCVLVAVGCRRGVFPWPLLAATVSPAGPVGSTIGIEWLARRAPRVA